MASDGNNIIIQVEVPNEEGVPLYETGEFAFSAGLNVLVGCNGSGKTSLMKTVMRAVRNRHGASSRMFSVTGESHDGPGALLLSGRAEDVSLAATMLGSSEGERMAEVLGQAFKWIGAQTRKEDITEVWLMLDSADSGMDIPTIRMVKGVIKDVARDFADSGSSLIVLMSANGYAIAEGEPCIDVTTGRRLSFGSWEEYSDFCMGSSEAKERRYQEIAEGGRSW